MILNLRSCLAVVLAVLISSPCIADPENATGKAQKPTNVTAIDKSTDKGIALRARATGSADDIIPELSFQDVKLDDVVDYLQDVVPNFKAVVIRDANLSPDVPQIRLRLKKVSLDQFLELLSTAYPGVEVSQIPGSTGTVHVIKVRGTEEVLQARHQGGAGAGVRVYALAPYINYIVTARPEAAKDKATANKEALNQILSLIKATLAQVGDTGSAQPVIQVHEETQTLIVKGNVEQQSVLEDVLGQLIPKQWWTDKKHQTETDNLRAQLQEREKSMEYNMAREKAMYQDRLQDLEKMLDAARKRLEERDTIAARNAAELERLRVRLEAMGRGKSGGESKPGTKSE